MAATGAGTGWMNDTERHDGGFACAAVFLFCFGTFYFAPVRTPWDSWFTIHTTYSLLHGQWGDLTDFVSFWPTHHSIAIAPNGHPFSIYPIGPSLFAIPVVAIADLLIPNLSALLLKPPVSMELEALTVATWCALAAVLMMVLATRLTGNILIGIVAAFIFAFCSPIFSSATRALWQHGPVVVCTLATMLVLHASERRPRLVPLAGLFVALAFICRPLTAPLVVLTAGYVAIYHRPQLVRFLAVGVLIAALWMAYNYAVWGNPLPPYYRPGTHANDFAHWRGRIFGPLISPGRGLFVFCPIFLFSLVGIVLRLRARAFDRFDGLYLAVIGCHIVVIAFSPFWWAGHSFGPRFMADIVPMLVYFLLPVLVYVAANFRTAAGIVTAALLAAAMVVSLLINAQGAFNPAVSDWNPKPVDIDSAAGYRRLWDWRDLQFLRGTGFDRTHPGVLFWRLIKNKPAG